MWSVPSLLRLSSHWRTMWCRERPVSLGPPPAGMQTLVARSSSSRRLAIVSPSISSDPPGIDVGGVEEVDTCVQAHLDLPPRPGDVGRADLAESAPPPEGHRAEGQRRDEQARAS